MRFSSYVNKCTEHFIGREWVFKEVNNWLANPFNPRIFLLVGNPGTGKTAIAARLVQWSDDHVAEAFAPALRNRWLTYSHFCQAGLDSTLSPLTFVQSLSETLANGYPDFRVALEEAGSRHILINQDIETVHEGGQVIGAQVRIEIKGGDARPLFDQAVRIPLQKLCTNQPTERIVILVDSLDEAITFNAENNITQLLKLVSDFPPQVRFLLTCRSNSERVFNLISPPTLDLIADAPPGLDEVQTYAISRLNSVPEVKRKMLASRVAEKSGGNFLYAFHVLNDLILKADEIEDPRTLELPDELEGVYRKFIEREMASNPTRWNDVYRPLLGPIAVARGEGLTKAQLIGITDLAEDTANDVLDVCAQYLVGGELTTSPYRIYHQSFRDFLLEDERYTIYPAERHAAIARYFQEKYGANWGRCDDQYALRYTPVHWADSAILSEAKRETRTQELIMLTGNRKYQRAFEIHVGDLPILHEYLHRAVVAAALNENDDMLPWLFLAAEDFHAFRQNYLRGEAVVMLADEGKLEQAERRLSLFIDIDQDWQVAARLIIAWLGVERNKSAAERLRDAAVQNLRALEPLSLLKDRVNAALIFQPQFPFDKQDALSIEIGQELVKRVSGQEFNRNFLGSVNQSFITKLGFQSEMINQRGYAATFDGPILVHIAREHGREGTELVDQYIDAHAGYNYVEYRNRSLWMVLHAVVRHHPDQAWVKQRLRHLLVTALSGGGVDFTEMLPLTVAILFEMACKRKLASSLDDWCATALAGADALQNHRGANDSWGSHKRRLTALMELYQLLFNNTDHVATLLNRIFRLPDGFAGFQAPAKLRLTDALRACRMETPGLIDDTLKEALRSAHHIQDYHFCARITARCNALNRWHHVVLSGKDLAETIRLFVRSPIEPEFAADHFVYEPYQYRDDDPDMLSICPARKAETLEQLVEVFQRPAVEFRRLNPQYSLTEKLRDRAIIRVPDPGFAPLLAGHLAARVLADHAMEESRTALLRALVPVAVNNPTALDTVLSYLLIAAKPDDPELLEEIVAGVGPVVFADVAASAAQIGPDAATPV
jgi:hypothetical protein